MTRLAPEIMERITSNIEEKSSYEGIPPRKNEKKWHRLRTEFQKFFLDDK